MAKRKKNKSRNRKGNFLRGLFKLGAAFFTKVFPMALILVLGGAVFFGVREVLYADSQLQIKSITVDPPASVSIGERQALESKYLGKNVFHVSLEKIARELEVDPEIRLAKVVRHFPSHLVIHVERRQPLAQIRFSSRDKYGLISEDGMILEVSGKPVLGMPVIEAPSLDAHNLHVGFQVKHRGFQQAVRFAKAFWNEDLSKNQSLNRVSFDHLGNVTIQFASGPEIRLGRSPADRIPSLRKIAHLLKSEEGSKIQYIDLQFDNVIVKKKGR